MAVFAICTPFLERKDDTEVDGSDDTISLAVP